MQLKIWIDDSNWIVINTKLSGNSSGGSSDGPEVTAAFVGDHKLSDLEIGDILDITGQAIDFLTVKDEPVSTQKDDWRDRFRKGL